LFDLKDIGKEARRDHGSRSVPHTRLQHDRAVRGTQQANVKN
jgi:hypothetical protein